MRLCICLSVRVYVCVWFIVRFLVYVLVNRSHRIKKKQKPQGLCLCFVLKRRPHWYTYLGVLGSCPRLPLPILAPDNVQPLVGEKVCSTLMVSSNRIEVNPRMGSKIFFNFHIKRRCINFWLVYQTRR